MNGLDKRIGAAYAFALHDYLEKRDEEALRGAYEIGRDAVRREAGLLQLVAVHHEVLQRLLPESGQDAQTREAVRAAGDFLRESVAAFEMIRRGFQETVLTLRQKTLEMDRLNRELRDVNESLEAQVAERSELAEARARELAHTNEELEKFVHASSHDLKEPLRTITSYVQLLEKIYGRKLGKEAGEYTRFVVDATRRLQQLIDDLLTYNRLRASSRAALPTDFSKVLEGVLSNLEKAVQETRAKVTWEPLPVLEANPAHIALLFQNLVGNALKFRGKVPPRVHVSALLEGSVWRFCVSDNGIGIDAKHSGRIFEVFQRLHTRDQYPGTGIGLALCRKIVEQMGGRIWVESREGEGAKFFFTLPTTGKEEGDGELP